MSPLVQQVGGLSAAVVAALMGTTWLLSLRLRNASIVDLVWGMGFVLIAWASFLYVGATGPLLLPCLTSLWGVRLSVYLAWRNHGKPEDFRYQAMRRTWGARFPLVSLGSVFALQGAIMWLVSLPVQYGIAVAAPAAGWVRSGGVVLWTLGFLCESVGDWQLAKFKANPANRHGLLQTGLWRYTRHPNYFGDFLVWWGLYLIALSQGAAWWTVIGPLVMSVLLRRVSGVTLLEKSLKETKPGYAAYVRRTNAFFPWPPSQKS